MATQGELEWAIDYALTYGMAKLYKEDMTLYYAVIKAAEQSGSTGDRAREAKKKK